MRREISDLVGDVTDVRYFDARGADKSVLP